MTTRQPRVRTPLHSLHALLLAFPVALFPFALATDITYLNTAEMQWSNFSSWLLAGALLFGGIALLWAIVGAARGREAVTYPVLLAAAWLLGLLNAFHHSRDAWSSVGVAGVILSLSSAILVLAAGWTAFAYAYVRGAAR